MLALASLTAAIKNNPVRGILNPKIIEVIWTPKSGCPELSSKIEPTAAIAVTQEEPRKKPLFGVKYTTNHPMLLVSPLDTRSHFSIAPGPKSRNFLPDQQILHRSDDPFHAEYSVRVNQ